MDLAIPVLLFAGIATVNLLNKLEFGGDAPAGNACLVQRVSLLPKSARYRYCKAFDKLEFT